MWVSRNILRRSESFIIFLIAIFAFFFIFEGSIWWFVLFIILPDIAFFAYFINKETGGFVYNLLHLYVLPIILLALSVYFSFDIGYLWALGWIAHIGADRVAGYDLKSKDGPDKKKHKKKGNKKAPKKIKLPDLK